MLAAASSVSVARSGQRRYGGGLVVGGGRRGRHSGCPRDLSPGRRVEESAVSASVQVGVCSLGLGRHGGRVGARAGGCLRELVFEPLHLLSQTLHRMEAVGGDRMRKGLGTETGQSAALEDAGALQ